MDTITIIISILSLIISIICMFKDHARDIKLNKINLVAEYYNQIYKDHLIKGIPKARKYIGFTESGHLRDTDELRKELNDIRQDSLYFLYTRKNYYLELRKKTQNLEDYLLQKEDQVIEGEEKSIVLNEIQEKISDLYQFITDNYLGDTF